MADTAPIELPTGRRSYIAPASGPNIHDKDWIPVLNEADLKKVQQYQEKEATASLTVFPKVPTVTSPTTRPQLTHNYSKSSLAPESVASELEADPLPPRTSSRRAHVGIAKVDPAVHHLRQTSADAPSSDGQETVTSEADAPSTAGTTSLLEEQYYTLPDAPVTKEDIQPPPLLMRDMVSHSARSSIASTRTKASIGPPTSKYNRKPVASTVLVEKPAARSRPTTPHDSPKLLPSLPVAPPIPQREASSANLPAELSQTTPPATPLHASKSTVSERRARALHSHPSNISLQSQPRGRSRANSSSSYTEGGAKPASRRHRSRKSNDSRSATRGAIYDGQTPTPAPTTPLPQLPPEAASRKPSLRHQDSSVGLGLKTVPSTTNLSHVHTQSRPASPATFQQPHQPTASTPIAPPPAAHFASPYMHTTSHSHTPSTATDHTHLASFMTSHSTIVFRRFDDVHGKLLCHLQDEIGQLERELMRLEGAAAAPGGLDKATAKMKVMRELRRCVSEYGESPPNDPFFVPDPTVPNCQRHY
jgi:hypothetical protein